MEMKNRDQKLMDNEIPFAVIKINNDEFVKMFWSSKRGLNGYQVTALRFKDYKFINRYSTTGGGYCKQSDALGNILHDQGFKNNSFDGQLMKYHVDGNFYDLQKGIKNSIVNLYHEIEGYSTDLKVYANDHGLSLEAVEQIHKEGRKIYNKDLKVDQYFTDHKIDPIKYEQIKGKPISKYTATRLQQIYNEFYL